MGVWLSRVRHTVMLHGRVFSGVPYELKLVYPPVLTRPRHTGVSCGHVDRLVCMPYFSTA
ncbi:hypothetical protein F383_34569 [Gossypium arboreum]|uniref:Uncharacterized protein n=1 Tax=Gossypium arboreum TaxID=29729 RepID=A0A0B0N057_GOSAR|nr:hypothetical protein F383_34569 [Gossypium arboreum]